MIGLSESETVEAEKERETIEKEKYLVKSLRLKKIDWFDRNVAVCCCFDYLHHLLSQHHSSMSCSAGFGVWKERIF